jgi:RHS repeat-associated protein
MGEKVVSGATTTWHDYLQVDGKFVAERFCTGAAPCSGGATWSWFVGDELGSASVLTNGAGTVTERDSYDAWGRRRNANGTDNAACSITSATTRGFTGHEMLDSVCEIDANARIYDPTLGKFLTPDDVVPYPYNAQSYNRYAYVNDNPLSFTDPTGHALSNDTSAYRATTIHIAAVQLDDGSWKTLGFGDGHGNFDPSTAEKAANFANTHMSSLTAVADFNGGGTGNAPADWTNLYVVAKQSTAFDPVGHAFVVMQHRNGDYAAYGFYPNHPLNTLEEWAYIAGGWFKPDAWGMFKGKVKDEADTGYLGDFRNHVESGATGLGTYHIGMDDPSSTHPGSYAWRGAAITNKGGMAAMQVERQWSIGHEYSPRCMCGSFAQQMAGAAGLKIGPKDPTWASPDNLYTEFGGR